MYAILPKCCEKLIVSLLSSFTLTRIILDVISSKYLQKEKIWAWYCPHLYAASLIGLTNSSRCSFPWDRVTQKAPHCIPPAVSVVQLNLPPRKIKLLCHSDFSAQLVINNSLPFGISNTYLPTITDLHLSVLTELLTICQALRADRHLQNQWK